MGKNNGRKRVMKRDFRNPREDKWQENKRRREDNDGWTETATNEAFEQYYKDQQIVPEGEWEQFMASLRTPLPTTFRINGSGKFAADLRDKLQSDFLSNFTDGTIKVGEEVLQAPRPLPWYPDSLGWQLSFSRGQLRKLPVLEQIHEFMKRENEAGGITRQEAVSMVPPLFLDVQPHHRVLDTCAAPGSKTFQLLEALHRESSVPEGLVVANDAEAQRCNLLVHQTKRMCSPALIVTNHEAQNFPLLRLPGAPQGAHATFHRILCDVPCSGDGTIRKAPDIWRKWSHLNGNNLHNLQIRITLRAAQLLTVGGRMVYSTCTFNPVEDEAVVAEVLRRCEGALQLLDVGALLPALARQQGLHAWRVRGRAGTYTAWDEACQANEGKLERSMFPDEASGGFPLERCMRVLPHHADTGGFFIAVLQKTGAVDHLDLTPSIASMRQKKADRRGPRAAVNGHAAAEAVPAAGAAVASSDAAAAPAAVADAEVEQPVAAPPAAPEGADASAPAAEPAAQATAAAEGAAEAAAAAAEEAVGAAAAAVQVAEAAVLAEQLAPAEAISAASDAAEEALELAAAQVASAAAVLPEPEVLAQAVAHAQEAMPAGPSAPTATTNGVGGGGGGTAAWGTRGGGARGRPGGKWNGIDPVVPILDPGLLSSIEQFYGLTADSPVRDHLVTRSVDVVRAKRLYLVSGAVKALLVADEQEQLKITSTGVKVFERQEIKDRISCAYRIAQEGLPLVLPYLTKQLIYPTPHEFLRIITERSIPLPAAAPAVPDADAAPAAAPAAHADGSDPAAADATPASSGALAAEVDADAAAGAPAPAETASATAEACVPDDAAVMSVGEAHEQPETALVQEQRPAAEAKKPDKPKAAPLSDEATLQQLESIQNGCCVLKLREEDAAALGFATGSGAEGAITAAAPLAICCWRGRASISVLVSKPECAQIIDKLKAALEKAAPALPAAEVPAAL